VAKGTEASCERERKTSCFMGVDATRFATIKPELVQRKR
jgi:hypothetical protein